MKEWLWQGAVTWWAGLLCGALVALLMAIASGCGTINGIASDIEIGARALKEGTTPYTQRQDSHNFQQER